MIKLNIFDSNCMINTLNKLKPLLLNNDKNPINKILYESIDKIESKNENFDQLFYIIDAILDKNWENLNTGHWKDVSNETRRMYSITSFIKVIELKIIKS